MSEGRSKFRRGISMLLASAMIASGGLWFLWMFFFTPGPLKLMIWAMPITIFAVGVAILWDDIKE